MGLFRYTRKTFARELALLAGAVLFAVPVYILVVLSLKTPGGVAAHPLSFPTNPQFGNYSKALHFKAGGTTIIGGLINSLIITTCSIIGLIVVGSLASYTIARRPGKLSTATYIAFLLGVIIPFQLGLVPVYVAMRHLSLVPSYYGMILLNIGLLMPLTVFLYTGFVRALPVEYEEAAQVDGASLTRTYIRVVFPLLRPVTATVAILAGVITWNEFFVPLVFLSGSKYQTFTVALYSFVGDFVTQWNYIFAAVVISIVPILLFYILAQRQLIRGFSGGVRG
ncbi:MAG TPA: carbohydrate ABC transporter permease [Gaiellaceae bacterium]|nr:carbohydrate ABC transporter permease [Gaiellaceae bacterium]